MTLRKPDVSGEIV